MRILYLMFSFTVGGTEKLVIDICNEMSLRGYKVFLYVINNFYSEEILKEISSDVIIELQNRTVGKGNILQTILRINKFIRSNDINVVHCNSMNAPEIVIPAKLIRKDLKIIHTIHGVGQYKMLPVWKRKIRNMFCDNLIAISKSVLYDIVQNGAIQEKVQLVYNAIDIRKFQNLDGKAYDNRHIIIGNVARIMPEKKGQDILIKAIAKLKPQYPCINCYFAGDYDENHELHFLKLNELVEKLDLKDNVSFLGNIENIQDFLKGIDIFVLPSRSEGFGISLIEAMAMGIPCIASNDNGPREIISTCRTGNLFTNADVDDLTRVLRQCIENYEEEKEKAQRNVSYIRSHYGIKEMCDKLIMIYGR